MLQQGASSTVAYFGQGLWYNLYDHSTVDATSGGRNQTVYVRSLSLQHCLMLGHSPAHCPSTTERCTHITLNLLSFGWCGQAAPTDNPPVYVLGGNIVPIGVNGTNTTTGARTGKTAEQSVEMLHGCGVCLHSGLSYGKHISLLNCMGPPGVSCQLLWVPEQAT